ncbi:septal ring lytic transglycosylase RlpA family protein [Teredinibacter turnerae]|uniref:Endolytic peptidoglycan transglycosylase RlpA n=1 Tax=Teredinibacter turnerae (strain ATCC 39867 / T7901) TaxID=377629 RepID=C5BNN6_TERTT|nr:septal ring lytic transglycosylase RlpA family protein [Teredinibacter turnerae]ACR14200.1 rare lipoprotein A [Teredinibacter turnerae T7901]
MTYSLRAAVVVVISILVFVAGCEAPSRYQQKHDSGPSQPLRVDHIPDAVPQVELRTAAGNKSPYTVNGKTYWVATNPTGYREEGMASWYGLKFHGHKTSNGEIYDMYGMTAAHKTLPIPSYVRVTNKDNGRVVIVRVNDRGPFHDGRVIDLTYAAAKKLDIVDSGTGRVVVEYIDPLTYQPLQNTPAPVLVSGDQQPAAPAPANSNGYQLPENTFLQVGAFSQISGAQALQTTIRKLTPYPVTILEPQATAKPALYRVRIGPLRDNFDLQALRAKIAAEGLPEPHVVYP